MKLHPLTTDGTSEGSVVVRLLPLCFAVFIFYCAPLFSQGNLGQILGTVTDQSGGVVTGATVIILDTQRGVSRTLTTNESGEYNAPNLIPGTYTVRAAFRGFKTVERSGILIEVGQEARVDLSLQPGEQSEKVTVTEVLPLIETTNATLGGTLSNETINDLPLNGRNFENLLTLRPGVTIYPGGAGWSQSTNGLRAHDNVYMVGGINNDEPWTGQSIVNGVTAAGDAFTIVPIDSIQEFKTEQNPRAEYGWKPGSIVNVGIKSGTNNFHGSAYAFGRDTALDARDFFNPAAQPKSPVGLEQFGATTGAPIIKDKLFFFTSYEGLRYNVGVIYNITTPVTCAGGSAGCGLTTNNPGRSLIDACNSVASASRTALSLKIAGLNPDCSPSSNFPNLLPVNNGTLSATDPRSFVPGFTSTSGSDNGLAKIDYQISDHHSFNGMYFIGNGDGNWNDTASQVQPFWLSYIHARSQIGSGSWTWAPNSTWVNEVRGGYARYYQTFFSVDHNVNPTTYGINTGVTNPLYFGFPVVVLQGFSAQLGAGWPKVVGPDGVGQIVDHVSYLRGKHAFKFGGEAMLNRFNGTVTANAKGNIRFGPSGSGASANTTLQNYFRGIPNRAQILVGNAFRQLSNQGYAAFLQDDWRVTPKVIVNLGLRYELNTVFKEDNNLIGSFDPARGIVQVGQQISSPFRGDHNNFAPRLGIAWDVQGNGKTVVRAGASIMYEQLSYDVFIALGNLLGLRTVPTGASIYVGGVQQPSPGNIDLASFSFSGAALTSVGTAWQNNASSPLFSSATAKATCGDGVPVTGLSFTPSPCTTAGVSPNLRSPYVGSWTLDFQRALTNNISLEVGYVGNHGVKLVQYTDLNQPPMGSGWTAAAIATCLNPAALYKTCKPDAAAEQKARPYYSKWPYLNYIDVLTNLDSSSYNSLQTVLTARNYHGLSLTAGYTYAHAIDIASDNWSNGSGIPLDSTHPGLYRGSGVFDLRHNLTFSVTYNLPGKKSPGQMLEGWSVNSIAMLQGGKPWDARDTGNDFSGTAEIGNGSTQGERWDFFGNPKDFQTVHGLTATNGIPFFAGATNSACAAQAEALDGGAPTGLAQAALANAGCYALRGSILTPPPYGTYGTMGRNIFRDSGFRNWDFSVTKLWRFTERLNAQFRVEFFNILNHPDFANPGRGVPDADPSGAAFGCGCATPDQAGQNPVLGSGGPRATQLGLKLIF